MQVIRFSGYRESRLTIDTSCDMINCLLASKALKRSVQKAFIIQNGYYEEMASLIRSIFEQALKTNDSLYFAVLTGCLRVSKESIFTGLNNPKIFSIAYVYYITIVCLKQTFVIRKFLGL